MCWRWLGSFCCISLSVCGLMWRWLMELELRFVEGDKDGWMWIVVDVGVELKEEDLVKMVCFLDWMVLGGL